MLLNYIGKYSNVQSTYNIYLILKNCSTTYCNFLLYCKIILWQDPAIAFPGQRSCDVIRPICQILGNDAFVVGIRPLPLEASRGIYRKEEEGGGGGFTLSILISFLKKKVMNILQKKFLKLLQLLKTKQKKTSHQNICN